MESLNDDQDLRSLLAAEPELKVKLDTAWVYARLALDELRAENLDRMREFRSIAVLAFKRVEELQQQYPQVASEQRLREVDLYLHHLEAA